MVVTEGVGGDNNAMTTRNLVSIVLVGAVCRAAAPQDAGRVPAILPPAPDGWVSERINFPLPFAPDLQFKGFEELRFAPGMFNAKSDTYFTYLFAVRLDGRHKVDAAFLRSFLLTYYRGLCRAVGEDRKLEIADSAIKAEVRGTHFEHPGVNAFSARLDIIDAFVTGKPLVLNVDILARTDTADGAEFFALVSPKPRDHEVWHVLSRMRLQYLRARND